MKTTLRKATDRGSTKIEWLDSKHSFSFGNYYDPHNKGFGLLRVLNDDIIDAGQGFDMHPHANMEIISIVLEGLLEHKDSMGNHGTIKPGEIQRMSAGSGILHSEWNPSKKEKGKFLQIWIKTQTPNIKPNYEQASFENQFSKNGWTVFIHPAKKDNALAIHQDAYLTWGNFSKDEKPVYILNNPSNGVYVFVIVGTLEINTIELNARDALEITDTKKISITIKENSKLLFIEVPMH